MGLLDFFSRTTELIESDVEVLVNFAQPLFKRYKAGAGYIKAP
jgi:hypothetical protein